MIKLQNGLVIMPEFMEALQKLMVLEIPVSQCVALSTAIEEINTQTNIVNRSKKVILEKYCLKDEAGKAKVDKVGNAIFENDETQQKCLNDIGEIMNETFELHLENKVVVPEDTKMTPQEFILLKDLIEVAEKESK